jgi:hypothetical protein
MKQKIERILYREFDETLEIAWKEGKTRFVAKLKVELMKRIEPI